MHKAGELGNRKRRKISDWRDADWFWPDGHQYPISSQHHTRHTNSFRPPINLLLNQFLIYLAINVMVEAPDVQYRLSFPGYYMSAALSIYGVAFPTVITIQ